MKLSILICCLKERQNMLQDLIWTLEDQAEDAGAKGEIEILTQLDNKEATTGRKRNILLERAKGDYICYFDDDDEPTGDYIKSILIGIEGNPDVVGMRGFYYLDGNYVGIFEHSIIHKEWVNEKNYFIRPPNHLNPVKRELALQTGFEDITFSEDKDYSIRLLPLLKTEFMLHNPIYNYMARSK